jgi:nicotinamidase-related amidase
MPNQPMLVDQTVLIVVDIQKGGALGMAAGIPVMPGYDRLVDNAGQIVAAARHAGLPIIFFQEAHRRSLVDFGRELDGVEGIHCLEGDEGTDLVDELQPNGLHEHFIVKRRYSCFFGTELEILLRGLQARTLVLIGGLTDVCVHYTFVDGHQHDYHMRVVDDCVIGSSQDAHDASLRAMEYLQTGARRTTDQIVAGFRSVANRAEPVGSSL